MQELRKDPISGRWVVIASGRGKRPSDFKMPGVGKEAASPTCPFCQGNEKITPPELLVYRNGKWSTDKDNAPDANGPGWELRVTDNKFPALTREGVVTRRGKGILDFMSGYGKHEVVIETPRHDISLAEMEETHIEKMIAAYKMRIVELEKDPNLKYVLVFRNYGKDAGASLAHPHSQIIATPVTPRYVKLEFTAAKQYFQEKERCIFCDLIEQEMNDGTRLVAENEHYVCIAPFASRFPYELWILPRRHHSGFQEMPAEQHLELARMLKDIMGRLMKVLNDPPYNYMLHTAPNPIPRPGRPDYWGTIKYDFHWHIEIIPRLTKVAGFEWGSGLYINPTSPEEATKYLREAA